MNDELANTHLESNFVIRASSCKVHCNLRYLTTVK